MSTHLFWNPGAVSYLVELLLAMVLAAYLIVRVVREWRQGVVHIPTLLLAVLTIALVPGFATSMLRVLTGGGWVSYAMPWSRLDAWTTLAMPWARFFGGISAAAYVLFAYRFPRQLRGALPETIAVACLLVVLLGVEGVIAVHTDIAIMARQAWWRPDWIAGWMNLAVVWAAIVFCRQFASAQRLDAGAATGLVAGMRSVLRRPANREAKAALAFIALTLLPIVHTAALFLPSEGQFGLYPLDIVICWAVLAQLVGLALVLFGYLPERTSFLFKLTAISLAVLLGAINGAAWMIMPAYQTAFRAPDMVSSGQSLRFWPGKDGRYSVQDHVFLPEPSRGQVIGADGGHVDLLFSVPFYGRSYDRIYVGSTGTIAFDRLPAAADAAFGRGVQPAIYPLLVDVPDTGTRMTAFTDTDRVIVTRRDRCGPTVANHCYAVQTILYADGRIDINYLDVPVAPRFGLFSPLGAPWLIGITPGPEGTAGTPVLRDYYRAFLAYLDRLFAPFVPLAIGTTLALLLGMPIVFRNFLLRPLDHLLQGIRRYRGGDLATQVGVSFNDEIGYLTESFNAMAREQQAMTQGLENRVADRVAEIADMTIRNTQLEERNRLSADLHDAVAQTLASASLLANALPAQLRGDLASRVNAAERVAELNRHALDEMRVLLTELRGESDMGAGGEWSVIDRLRDLIAAFSRLHGLKVHCEFSDGAPLPLEVRAMFYRVAQESLNNVVKHSGVDAVDVTFDALADRALLIVSDAGRGFDPALVDRHERLGLAIMRDRARLIGATLEIESRPDCGSRITMIWIR